MVEITDAAADLVAAVPTYGHHCYFETTARAVLQGVLATLVLAWICQTLTANDVQILGTRDHSVQT